MRQRKIFAGAKLRALRDQHSLTQGALAKRLDVSTSYINQIENNQRPLTAALMLALAEGFGLDLGELMSDTSDRLLADLREIFADPVFGETTPALMELKTLTANNPDTAHALLRIYEAYRKVNERLASADEAMITGPGGGIQTAYEEVRDFFHYAGNYIAPLDQAAEDLAAELGGTGINNFTNLANYLANTHDVKIDITTPSSPDMLRNYDRQSRTLLLNARLPGSTHYFLAASQLADMEQTTRISEIVQSADFKTEEAKQICRIGLANYFAGALQMPYSMFLKAAEGKRHDLEELSHQFGASLEQVAHRLSTLQKPGEKGVPFFFARVDAAGTITKRHSATPLQFARFGGACPLWNVHRAFESRGDITRQLAETPDGHRYISLAWAQEKRIGGHNSPIRRYAYALGCEVTYANRIVYADDLDTTKAENFDPIGVSCRTCERRNCPQRSVPPVAHAISVPAEQRAIVPYQID